MRAITAIAIWSIGCGRLGYGDRVDAYAAPDVPRDASEQPLDVPANLITATFGENGTTMFSSVTQDTILDWSSVAEQSYNYGASTSLSADATRWVGLLRFTLTAIPTTARVVSATLTLTVRSDASGGTVTISRILESWQEGSADTVMGVANYIDRLPGVAWTTSAQGPPSRDPSPLATLQPVLLATPYEAPLPSSVVEGWINDPASNFGMVLSINTNDGVVFASSDASNVATRPVLTVVYIP